MLYCKPRLPLQIEGLHALEERAEWKTAADRLRQVLAETNHEDYTIARVEETIAYFLIRASLQADERVGFDRTVAEAIASLVGASEHYQKSGGPNFRISAIACQARAQFLLAWTSPTPASRLQLLLQAYTSLRERNAEIDQLDDVQLQHSVLGDLLLYSLEWSSMVPFSNSSVESLVSLLNHVDTFLRSSPEGLLEERARILCLASQLARQAASWTEGNPLETKLTAKSVKLARLSQQTNGSDPFLTTVVDVLLGQTLADFESEPEAEENLWRNALKVGRELNDRYLTAWSSGLLCYNMAWKLSQAEEPDQANTLAEDCFRFGDEAMRNGSIIRFYHAISNPQAGSVSTAYYLLALSEPDRAKRRLLREKAVESARVALESAKSSGSLNDISNSYHSLSKSIEASSLEEPDNKLRKKTLSEALALRKQALTNVRLTVPPGTWTHGVHLHYLATLLSELANLEEGKTRLRLLSRAVRASTVSLESCSSTAAGSEEREKYGTHLARYFDSHARLLEQAYAGTGRRVFREGALAAYRKAGQIYAEGRLFGHSASTLWHSGTISHLVGAHEDSSREFGRSAEYYSMLEKNMPRLSTYFHRLSSYMNAWSQIESAHEAHIRGEYATASEDYRKASVLLQDSDRDYLSTNFLAWASMETAEDLSRGENMEKSIEAFHESSNLFEKCQKEISGSLTGIENPEERSVAKGIATFSESHAYYCRARALLDQGRLEELRGDYVSASRLHNRTANLLESTLSRLPVDQRSDLHLALDLAKGWSLLCAGRADSNVRKYLGAARLFKTAASESPNLRVGQYAMGNRFLSEALASETRFTATADSRFYKMAKRHLRSASICYSRADMDHSSLAVDARLSLLDASLYATKAEASADPSTRMRYLSLTERCLRHALQLYQRAGDRGNEQEVEKLLGKTFERKRLGKLLRGRLEHPTVASPASLLAGPSNGPESAVGITEVEERIVQGQLTLPDQLSDDDPFTITLDLVNVGHVPVSLLQLRDLLPSSVKVVKVMSAHSVQDGSVELNGKKLPPNAVESISLHCLSTAGLLELKPRILYLDGQGKPKGHQVALTARHVLDHATFEFTTSNSGAVFQFLAYEFLRDYMAKHLASEGSGWRSFPTIVKGARLPRSAVYSPRGLGTPLAELVKRGLVEVRIFSSQPGRGGQVQRARICYEKNPVRVYVDRLAMKTSEKPNPVL